MKCAAALVKEVHRWMVQSSTAHVALPAFFLSDSVSECRVAIKNTTFSYLILATVGGNVFQTSLITNDTDMCGLHGDVIGCQVIIP